MADYWTARALARQRAYDASAERTIRTVRTAYQRAEEQIGFDIANILRYFQENYGLTQEKAMEILKTPYTGDLLEALRAKAQRMRNSPEKREIMARLNAAAYKARIDRLEAAQMSIRVNMAQVADVETRAITEGLTLTAQEAYSRTMFDAQKGSGVLFQSNGLSVSRAQQITKDNWTGMNYSKRVWRNTEHVAEMMSQAMEEMAMAGQVSVRSQIDLWKQLTHKLHESEQAGEYAMQRLIRTEWSHVNNQAEKTALQECGMEKYRFDAVLDKKTSEKCRDLDGKVFLLKDAQEGKNYPPMHPNCRSLAVAVIDRKFTKNMTRMATDPKTGETQEIPFDMGYREWEAWQRAGAPDIRKWQKLQLTEEQKKDIMSRDWGGVSFRTVEEVEKHKKHFKQFGYEAHEVAKYEAHARELLSRPITSESAAMIRPDGSLARYFYKTNEFIATKKNWSDLGTMFQPEDRVDYWRDQYERNAQLSGVRK